MHVECTSNARRMLETATCEATVEADLRGDAAMVERLARDCKVGCHEACCRRTPGRQARFADAGVGDFELRLCGRTVECTAMEGRKQRRVQMCALLAGINEPWFGFGFDAVLTTAWQSGLSLRIAHRWPIFWQCLRFSFFLGQFALTCPSLPQHWHITPAAFCAFPLLGPPLLFWKHAAAVCPCLSHT